MKAGVFATYILCVLVASASWIGKAAAQALQQLYQTGRVEFTEDQVFGSDNDEDDRVLFGPVSICVDGDKNVYVLDYKMYCVKKFDSGGDLLLAFSRQGEGPGELARPYPMTLTPGGNLVVFDSGNHRLTVFDGSGEYVESRGFQGWVRGLHALPDGSFVVLKVDFKEDSVQKGIFYMLAKLGPELDATTPIDSIYARNWLYLPGGVSVTLPFVATLEVATSPSGRIVYANTGEYRLKILSPDLTRVGEITRDVNRVSVSDGDKEEYFNGVENTEGDFQILLRQKVNFPKHKPYISGLLTDDRGYILVEVPDETGSEETMYYDVFTPGGEFLKRVEMMTLKRSAVFEDGGLYMTRSSDDELPVVVRYRPRSVEQHAAP